MNLQARCFFRRSCLLLVLVLLPILGWAQTAAGGPQAAEQVAPQAGNSNSTAATSLTVNLTEQTGAVVGQIAVITLHLEGGASRQLTAQAGRAEFTGLMPGKYTIHVVADGYASLKQTLLLGAEPATANLQLRRTDAGPMDPSLDSALTSVAPMKTSWEVMGFSANPGRMQARIAEALRVNKPEKAHADLEKLMQESPMNANVNYLYGIYEKEMKDPPKARFYWQRTVSFEPKHFAALLELGHMALDEGKTAEAIPYLLRAAQANPTAWHPHAMLVIAYSKQKQYAEVVREAERALELGHGQAAVVEPVLARALVAQGDRDRALQVLQEFLKSHSDPDAKELLAALQPTEVAPAIAAAPEIAEPSIDVPPLLPSAWMPPGVDDSVPSVEPGVPCHLDTVLKKTSIQLTKLVSDVDRFEATESMEHERITGRGLPAKADKRTFRYLVSIEEIRPGLLAVDEYRKSTQVPDDYPDEMQTVGLPALVLVFHPMQLDNYKFTCEGLSRSSAGLAWQVYFQQRPDRIPTLHGYGLGNESYAVGLKGRAWISADTYQVVRLETDLVKPHPEIRLVAEHTFIEYGPVRFRSKKEVKMWLPQTAEVYFDWRGKRIHRRLSYSNYLLFSVDDKQIFKAPKNSEAMADPATASPVAKPN